MISDSRFQIPDLVRSVACGSWISNLACRAGSAILALAFLLTAHATAQGQDIQVTASTGSDTVGVQDQFELSITVSGKDSGEAENPRLSRLPGFKVVSGPSISTQFQWINGRSNSSKSFIYILIPEREGQFTIDPVEVRVGGKAYKTQPLQIRVTSAPRNPQPQSPRPYNPLDPFGEEMPPNRSIGDAVFIRAEVDQKSAYPGQQVTLTYRLYTQVGISGIQLQDSPPLSGFWVEDLEVDKNPRGARRVLNGREYQEFTIKKQALFATTTGRLRIPSSTFAISAGTGGDLFGIFSRSETLYRKTDEVVLEVKPLPEEGRPADFRNAVGSFSLSARMDKDQVATGEAVTVTIKLDGKGNLKMMPDITLPSLPDFTVYSSKKTDSVRTLADGQIGGDKAWEFVVVPKAPGRQAIPELSFSYFDPGKGKYETVKTPPLSLNVVRGTDSSASLPAISGIDKQNLVRQGVDINFIKQDAGDWESQGKPVWRSSWFYLAALAPLIFNVGAFVVRKRRSRYAGNIGILRFQKARRTALLRLKTAEKKAGSDARRFYDQAATALSGYLTDKFGLTEIELTGDHLERALTAKSVPREVVEETRGCLQECDFGRFVSASPSTDKMRELSARIRRNIEAMERTAKTISPALMPLVLLSFLAASWNLYAQTGQPDAAKLFAEGNAEYQRGNFAVAEQYYSRILNTGIASGPLYFNLGNTCFKQKRLGDAIYYWEKARQLSPSDKEIQQNLELANLRIVDRLEVPADPLPIRWITAIPNLTTVGQETWLILSLYMAANILLSFCLLARTPRSSARAFRAFLAVSILLIVFAGSWSWKLYEQNYRKSAIVVEQKADVRSGPGPENIAVFTVHEGLRVRVHEFNNGWYQVSLPNGWSGWLRQTCIRIL